MLFSWTLWNQYQPLLLHAGKAQNYATLRLFSSWQGNHSHITEQQQLKFYILIRNIVKQTKLKLIIAIDIVLYFVYKNRYINKV